MIVDKVNEDIRSGSIFKGIEISECESGALKESLTMQELAIIKAYRNADFDHKRIALIALYKVKPNKIPFEDWEVENIIKGWNAGDDFCGYILTMLYTGMRYGEMIDIRPENVHLDGLYLLAGKKTDAGREPINFTEELKPIIQKLFLDGKRYQYSDTTFKKHFKDCLKRNGCNDHLPHECRHTFATDMKNSKQNGMVIKDSMRHSSYTQTATYTHTSSEDIRKAIKESMPALVLTR